MNYDNRPSFPAQTGKHDVSKTGTADGSRTCGLVVIVNVVSSNSV